jgi:actin-related protein
MLDPFKMVPLELMIAYSISQCRDNEQRKRMANSILIIGGSVQFAKFIQELEDRLIENINAYCPSIERVDVIDCILSRDILPANLSWYGATVVPRLETIKDMLVHRNRWMGEVHGEE